MANKVHSCKAHSKPYTVCPKCGCQYCETAWPICPRNSWHPAHGTTDADVASRYRVMDACRAKSEANLRERGL